MMFYQVYNYAGKTSFPAPADEKIQLKDEDGKYYETMDRNENFEPLGEASGLTTICRQGNG